MKATVQDLLAAARSENWELAFRIAWKLLKKRPRLVIYDDAIREFELLAQAKTSDHTVEAKKIALALRNLRRGIRQRDAEFETKIEFDRFLNKGTLKKRILKDRSSRGHWRAGRKTGRAPQPSVLRVRHDEVLMVPDRSVELHQRKVKPISPRKKPIKRMVQELDIVERTPHLDFQSAGTEFRYEVFVYANTSKPDAGAAVEPLKFKVPKNISQFTVSVSFYCSDHFRVEGTAEKELVFRKSEEESSRASFVVLLIEPDSSEPMFFRAMFRFDERPSGKITQFLEYNPQAQSLARKGSGPTVKKSQDHAPKLPNDIPTSSITVDFNAHHSDIRIEVIKTPTNNGRSFELRCFTPSGNWKGLWILPIDSETFVRRQMETFVQITGKKSLAKLKGAGVEFWNVVTKEARSCLKRAFTEHKISTISVLSEEPFVPWELMIPVARGETPVDCLGVSYGMGRWVTGDFRSPSQSIPMKTAFIVAPEGSGLKLARKEAAFLRKTFPRSPQIKPVSYDLLDEELKTSRHSIVHFVCHGEAAGIPTLKHDPEDVLNSSEILGLDGFLAAFHRHPFTFLNACEVGQPVRSLDGLGGFVNSFLDLGASAVVAPLWSVEDSVAEKVCKRFYRDVLSGKTFGKTMQRIRARAFELGVDTYASYCYYGDPKATAVNRGIK